jgi:outer membrane protein insertion porin family
VTLAAFADIGSAFNLRSGADQGFSSDFIDASTFLPTRGTIACRGTRVFVTLNTLAACQNNSPLALSQLSGGLIVRDSRLISQEEFINALRVGPIDPLSGLPVGMQQVFLRGEAQTNTVVRNTQSVFSKIGDFRSSIGLEARFQVPIINVPFRLIYAYNPNARRGFVDELPGIFFNEKRNVFRFSVGRTF